MSEKQFKRARKALRGWNPASGPFTKRQRKAVVRQLVRIWRKNG